MEMKSLIEAMLENRLNGTMQESIENPDTLKNIADKIRSDYGLEPSISKSTLGETPSYFMKVFGPKNTWKNNIPLNSPFHVMFRIADGTLEMTTNSSQVRDAKAKMRKTKYKDDADLEKVLLGYFAKNKTAIKGILGEEVDLVKKAAEIMDMKKKADVEEALGNSGYVMDKNDLAAVQKKLNTMKNPPKVIKDKAGYFHLKYDDGKKVVGPYRTMKDVLGSLEGVKESMTFDKAASLASMREARLSEKASAFTISHKTFSSAVQHAMEVVEKRGFTVDTDEWDRKVALGPKKPSSGKTNSYTIGLLKDGKETKKNLQMQVYYDEGRYELNMYIS
jgi:hypothetical protein